MSTAVMSSPMFECGELFKNAGAPKKEMGQGGPGGPVPGNGHAPLRRSYTSLVSLIEQHRKLDRSVSEPTSRYKTELCRPFEESGSCKYGDKCQFAHGYSELRNLARHPKYKTELCRTFHKIGFCPYGPRCHFVHNFEEARIHNLKVSAQLGQAQPAGVALGLGPLLQPAAAAALGVNVSLLEQLAASPQVAAAVAAASASPLVRQATAPAPGPSPATAPPAHYAPHQPLHRSSSLGLQAQQQQQQQQHQPHQHQPHQHQHQHQHQQSSSILIGRPKPLNLSPTFSLGSAADSISPSSSLSQSPTNSMASFFSDEAAPGPGLPNTAFSFGQDFGLLSSRQSPSPQAVLDELSPRTPSPLSPNAESRLPVFNRISSTLADLDNLKI